MNQTEQETHSVNFIVSLPAIIKTEFDKPLAEITESEFREAAIEDLNQRSEDDLRELYQHSEFRIDDPLVENVDDTPPSSRSDTGSEATE